MSVQEDGAPPKASSIDGYAFGAFRVHITSRKLFRGDEPVTLPSRVFDLLVYLLRHHDQVVDKDALIKAGWADAFVTEDSLIHGISVLRRALGDDSSSPRFIVTLPRRGYQFVGPVQELGTSLEAAGPSPGPVAPSAPPASAQRPWLWVALGLAGVVIAFVTIWGNEKARPVLTSEDIVRLAQLPPRGTTLMSGGSLSPDGRQMAFVARDSASGKTHLWVRRLDSPEPWMVEGTEGASRPFWSPRADALGYFVGNNLVLTSLAGDPPRTISSSILNPAGGSWGAADVILFADSGRGIYAVSARGGQPRHATTVDPGSELFHAWPQFLPDGRRFLYSVQSSDPAKKGTWVGSLDPAEGRSLLLRDVIGGVYSPSGHLLYVQSNTLIAVSLNSSTLQMAGAPRVVARNVPAPQLAAIEPVSASGSVLCFRTGPKPHQLTRFDRSGRRIGAVPTPTSFYNPALSSDERVLAVAGLPPDEPGLWVIDLDRNVSTRLAPDGVGPMISPDNKQIAYTARGGLEIRIRNLVGQAAETVLLQDDRRKTVQDWSPDGRFIVFSRMDPGSGLDLWMLPLSESRKPVPLLATPANERQARISPDGRWIAYTSDESGTLEVYIQELPGLGTKRTLSVGGGVGPVWARGGRELLYLSTDRRLMSVEFGSAGPSAPARPVALFSPPLAGDVWQARNYFVASRDGKQFLFNAVDQVESIPITVMVNWLVAARTGA